MAAQLTKRVWDKVATAPCDGGFEVFLDGRLVRTPAKSKLILPTRALAQKIAQEWEAQKGHIKPDTMPFTRTANSAIDNVATQKSEVANLLAAYGDSDLLCYRADSPAKLVARQNDAWDPLLDWADHALGARLLCHTGVIHVPQAKAATDTLAAKIHEFSTFELTGFHDLVALSGSLILAFAVARNFRDAREIWSLSRVDENWQIDQWGEDEEAAELESVKRKSFFDAETFLRLANEKA